MPKMISDRWHFYFYYLAWYFPLFESHLQYVMLFYWFIEKKNQQKTPNPKKNSFSNFMLHMSLNIEYWNHMEQKTIIDNYNYNNQQQHTNKHTKFGRTNFFFSKKIWIKKNQKNILIDKLNERSYPNIHEIIFYYL